MQTTLFRARLSADALKKTKKSLSKRSVAPGDAFHIRLAQVELRSPFDLTLKPQALVSAQEQAKMWTDIFGPY